ncbi:hypothetical protein VE23_17590 [Paenibacillus sp. D9]|uniref:hypothetical protein n=1 Tax=Paenibacillus humicus TaxID=412861 RepID=UPI00038F61F2|nr:hypothetical protein [Paenibacillus humicus]KKC48488.1 hypothetical protein VE23_17590 [Paenibacillus sp. D9]CDN42890.1 hypothetical protein BN871_CA_00020 [Paenibacillus sp. P22]
MPDEITRAYNGCSPNSTHSTLRRLPWTPNNAAEFDTKKVRRPHKPIKRLLGDPLERKSDHDAVHIRPLLQYMRMLQLERPDIRD